MANTRTRVGKNPRAYEGVRAINPPDMIIKDRDPRVGIGAGNPLDYEYDIGTWWLNETNFNLWMLVDKQISGNKVKTATWIQLNSTLVGDITEIRDNMGLIVTPDAGGAVNIVGDLSVGIFTTRTGPNTLTISSTTGNPFVQSLTGDDAVIVPANPADKNINVFGGNQINTEGAGNTLTINLDNTITLGGVTPVAPAFDALTIETGDVTVQSGNIDIPLSDAGLDKGVISIEDEKFFSSFRDPAESVTSTNWFIGFDSGTVGSDATSQNNIGLGNETLQNLNTAVFNIGIGSSALKSITDGFGNIAIGFAALQTPTVDVENNVVIGNLAGDGFIDCINSVIIGHESCGSMQLGQANTVVGYQALSQSDQSTKTIALGHHAALLYTTNESHNIIIGHPGVVGDNNTTRIGITGTGIGEQDRCFIAGIRDGVAAGSTLRDVIIDENDQLIAAPEGFAFLAYRNVTVNNVTGAGTTYTTQWDSVSYNFGSTWDGTDTFTAPIDCIAEFQATIRMTNIAADMTRLFARLQVSGQLDWLSNWGSPAAIRASGNDMCFTLHNQVQLDQGDTVRVQLTIQNGSGDTASFGAPNSAGSAISTWFGGRLLDALS
jgi:hypothetical protein